MIDYVTREPVADVQVGILGTTHSATTDRRGRYSLPYSPGEFFIAFDKDGYLTSELFMQIPTETRFPADTVQVYRRPEGPGVYLVDKQSGEYRPLEQGTLCEQDWSEHYGGTYWRTGRRYLIDVEPAQRNLVPPGQVTFVQYEIEQLAPSEIDLGKTTRTKGLELVQVDNTGYVLTRQTSFGSVVRDHTVKYPPVSERAPRDSLIFTTYDLGHGTYALLATRQRMPMLGYPFTSGTPNFHPTSICRGDVM